MVSLLALPVSNGQYVHLKSGIDTIVKGRWFHSVQIIPSLIGEKPGGKRNHFQKVFENFFMRPGLFA